VTGEVLYSGFKWVHHDDHSGYHHVVPDANDYIDSGSLWGGRTKIGSFRRKINMVIAEVLTLLRARRYRVVFYVYPENSALFFSAPILKLMGKQIVYALHLGEKYWNRQGSIFFRIKKHNLKFVDHFVVLSSQQQRLYEQQFPGRVSLIPHGVWLEDSFTSLPLSPPRVCVVGDNFRDYDLLRRIIERFAVLFPQIHFDLIGMQYGKLGEVAHAASVTCHARLSKTEYAQVIKGATFMLLPLHFATANNALLEAQALGIPVLCNRVDGVTDYLPDDSYLFDDIEHLCSLVEARLTMDEKQRAAESAALIKHLEQNFSWPVVRTRVISLCRGQGA